MICKTFEIRDKGTFIPALAICLEPSNESDRFLLSRAGYGHRPEGQSVYVLLMKLNSGNGRCTYNPHDWMEGGDRRTMFEAHRHIAAHFHELESGSVVDVEFVLGEVTEPKKSEMHGF